MTPERDLLQSVLQRAIDDLKLVRGYDHQPDPLTRHQKKRYRQVVHDGGDPEPWLLGQGGKTVCELLGIRHSALKDRVRRILLGFARQ